MSLNDDFEQLRDSVTQHIYDVLGKPMPVGAYCKSGIELYLSLPLLMWSMSKVDDAIFGKPGINPTIRLALRPNVEIAITGLPVDLTQAEYDRIVALINVFTIKLDNSNDQD